MSGQYSKKVQNLRIIRQSHQKTGKEETGDFSLS